MTAARAESFGHRLAADLVSAILRAPELRERLAAGLAADDPWLDVRAASAYLGMTPNALRKLVARRALAYEQERSGCKMWFRRTALDDYRLGRRVR